MVDNLVWVMVAASVLAVFLPRTRRWAIPVLVIAGVWVVVLKATGPEEDSTSIEDLSARETTYYVSFTSDPSDAEVIVGGRSIGRTPVTYPAPANREFSYVVTAAEPYADYDLYKPFRGTLTPAKDMAVSVWLERTAPEEQAAQRRNSELVRANQELRQLEQQLDTSRWRLSRQKDPITDEDATYVVTRATAYPTILNRDSYLMIRCDDTDPTSSDGIVLLINADQYLGSRDLPVDWRFDSNPAVARQSWRASTDGTAVFNMSYKTQFIRQMLEAELLTVRLYDFDGTGYHYTFDVSDSRAALTLLGCYRGPAL